MRSHAALALALGVSALTVAAVAAPGTQSADPRDTAILEVTATGKATPAPRDTGDVDAIKKRGALRVLIYGDDELLARSGAPAPDLERATALADRLGVEAVTIRAARFADLIPMLIAGEGDVIAARMTETPERAATIAFTRPAAVVREVVVGKSSASAPRTAAELAGKSVTVRASSSYAESLRELAPDARVELAPEDREEALLVRDVAAGRAALTVCDSDLFANVAAFEPGVDALFTLREGRQIALGVRKTNPKLRAAANALLLEHALTEHQRDASTADLAAIKKRGSLRVLVRNNATNYFLYRGVQQGFDFEIAKGFAKKHGLRVDVVVVPPDGGDPIEWLLSGKVDVIAAEMAITDARKQRVTFSKPYLVTDEVLIQRAGEPAIASVADLAASGRTVHVRASSSYAETLRALAGVDVVDAPEDMETEALIAQVAAGTIPFTVADRTIAAVEIGASGGAQATLLLAPKRAIAFGVRPDNDALRAALDAYLGKNTREIERLKRKYFARASKRSAGQLDVRATGKLSPYDAIMQKYAREYGIDWRLMAAQSYQESFFDPKAESWCGALGLFQVMPKTGRALGFRDVRPVEANIHAGIKYMAQLIGEFDPAIPFKHRVRFALASYNAGPHHVNDARLLAAEMGLDPDKWFGHVEKAMLRLEDPKVYRRMPHGYCRGSEPVKYVSDIQSRYDNWVSVMKSVD